ncbi:kynureninase [Octadecabacter sp. 1_MG-2023]|uniref:kynureninase n=1 Tax=unclassified Octadecabacter TaxID=196158 RepID=UPI001C094F39|nr:MULTISPECIES: kynureninase [unclassified Octadecabacter]MBU2994385.1 kynureninase [Octadecabacter sp. B2R22]MDO6734324.1 kynureninase [Octadecabacter sp. 1_MG-2023]
MTLPRKDLFHLPEGMIYLDGNSLGPLPKSVDGALSTMVTDQWGQHLIKGWNVDDWMGQPMRVGNLVGRLIGAPEGSVTMGDTLSVKVYQALSAAVQMRPDRKVILSDRGNFPSDLYMAQGLIAQLGQGHELRIVAPEEVTDAITDEVAAVMITHVDYRTGRMHDMDAITAKAQAAGAVMIWDLAHSAGAVPVDLAASGCEFAVGCTYKYLNGGPGAPAFIYVHPDAIGDIQPALSGWLGHDAPFAFDLDYRPAMGIERMRVGTPPVLQLTALEAAMAAWDGVDVADLRAASIRLTDLFIELVEARCPELTLHSPRDGTQRGSQVSFEHENGYPVMQALIARDVIGDFRAPNLIRFGFTPLYIDETDVRGAVDILADVLDNRHWDDPVYHAKGRVT